MDSSAFSSGAGWGGVIRLFLIFFVVLIAIIAGISFVVGRYTAPTPQTPVIEAKPKG